MWGKCVAFIGSQIKRFWPITEQNIASWEIKTDTQGKKVKSRRLSELQEEQDGR